MKRNIAIGTFAWLLAAFMTLGFSASNAQTITRVEFDLPSLDYDVIYLADFIDVSSNKLASNIPNFSGTIRANGKGYIVLHATVLLQLKGNPSPQELVYAETEPFFIDGSRSLTATDLATGSASDIKIKGNPYRENQSLRDKIQNYAKQFPTAPVGQYILQLVAFDSSNTINLDQELKRPLQLRMLHQMKFRSISSIRNPEQSYLSQVPTFTWTSPNPDVTLYVYEKLPYYNSLEEAVNGVPYLKQEVNGPQTFTYPAHPTATSRALEPNKSYVWYVEAAVTTNRQTVQKRSEIRLFRIQTDNRADQEVSDIMGGFGGGAAGTFSTLQSIGWTPTGTMTLDGKPLTLDDLKTLVAKLMAQNIQVNVRVE